MRVAGTAISDAALYCIDGIRRADRHRRPLPGGKTPSAHSTDCTPGYRNPPVAVRRTRTGVTALDHGLCFPGSGRVLLETQKIPVYRANRPLLISFVAGVVRNGFGRIVNPAETCSLRCARLVWFKSAVNHTDAAGSSLRSSQAASEVGSGGFEPPASSMSRRCHNRPRPRTRADTSTPQGQLKVSDWAVPSSLCRKDFARSGRVSRYVRPRQPEGLPL